MYEIPSPCTSSQHWQMWLYLQITLCKYPFITYLLWIVSYTRANGLPGNHTLTSLSHYSYPQNI